MLEQALVYGHNSEISCPAPEFQSDFASLAGFQLLANHRIYPDLRSMWLRRSGQKSTWYGAGAD